MFDGFVKLFLCCIIVFVLISILFATAIGIDVASDYLVDLKYDNSFNWGMVRLSILWAFVLSISGGLWLFLELEN